MASLADNLEPPYYAAIIANEPHRSEEEPVSTAEQLVTLAVRRPGFLGLETAWAQDGKPVTVAYWRDLADVEAWTSEGATTDAPCQMEVRRVATLADNSARTPHVVPEDSRTTWRYT